ncbi:hypothetical protein D3C85_1310910 [compost metagenome]
MLDGTFIAIFSQLLGAAVKALLNSVLSATNAALIEALFTSMRNALLYIEGYSTQTPSESMPTIRPAMERVPPPSVAATVPSSTT